MVDVFSSYYIKWIHPHLFLTPKFDSEKCKPVLSLNKLSNIQELINRIQQRKEKEF